MRVSKMASAITVLLIIICLSLSFLPSESAGSLLSSQTRRSVGYRYEGERRKMTVLGSRPPACVNKCLSCKPCTAALVVPPSHQRKGGFGASSSHGGDDGYYLLSWKCKCGNKFFQP